MLSWTPLLQLLFLFVPCKTFRKKIIISKHSTLQLAYLKNNPDIETASKTLNHWSRVNYRYNVKLWGISGTKNKRYISRTLENIYFRYLVHFGNHKETGIKGVESMTTLTFITVSQEQKQMLLLSALPKVFYDHSIKRI